MINSYKASVWNLDFVFIVCCVFYCFLLFVFNLNWMHLTTQSLTILTWKYCVSNLTVWFQCILRYSSVYFVFFNSLLLLLVFFSFINSFVPRANNESAAKWSRQQRKKKNIHTETNQEIPHIYTIFTYWFLRYYVFSIWRDRERERNRVVAEK